MIEIIISFICGSLITFVFSILDKDKDNKISKEEFKFAIDEIMRELKK